VLRSSNLNRRTPPGLAVGEPDDGCEATTTGTVLATLLPAVT
jgi:hypothetical protein